MRQYKYLQILKKKLRCKEYVFNIIKLIASLIK